MSSGVHAALGDGVAGINMLQEHPHRTILSLHAQLEEGTFILFIQFQVTSDLKFFSIDALKL
ncbi:MAG: hypothetical protein M3264_05730 [Thermoproteota archaeon]|nr:hypothetical protein [Thermoproteota archaeon]